MLVNAANVDLLFRKVQLDFQANVRDTEAWSDEICSLVPMNAKQVTYPWNSRLPIFREWIGRRQINVPSTHSKTITARPYEDSFAIQEEDLEADQYGLLYQNVGELGRQSKKLKDHRLSNFLINLCQAAAYASQTYDGKVLFATDHPAAGGTVDNTGGKTNRNLFVSTALNYDNLVSCISAMRTWVGEDGKPLGVRPTHLLVPPELEMLAHTLSTATLLANAATGVSAVTVALAQESVLPKNYPLKVVVADELGGSSGLPNNWFLLSCNRPIKPFNWHQWKAPKFTYRIQPDSDNVWNSRQYQYGGDAWGEMSESMWWLALAATSEAQYAHSA
jgi:phage major head subunit gpT-like protein